MEEKNSEDLIYINESEPEIIADQESQEVMDVKSNIQQDDISEDKPEDKPQDVEQNQRTDSDRKPDADSGAMELDELSAENDGRPSIKISRSTRVKREMIYKPGKDEID